MAGSPALLPIRHKDERVRLTLRPPRAEMDCRRIHPGSAHWRIHENLTRSAACIATNHASQKPGEALARTLSKAPWPRTSQGECGPDFSLSLTREGVRRAQAVH